MVDGPRQVAVSGVDPAGNVRLYADEGQKMSLSPANGGQSSVRDGVATTTSPGGETTSVSLLSEDMSAQVVTILKDESASYADFDLDLPEGYAVSESNNGALNITDANGQAVGYVKQPWALDADGNEVKTHYELRGDGSIRQIVDTKNAKYPLTLDPDAGWWAATAAKCAVDIAPLVATGGAAVASRVPKLVSFLNKLRKTKKIAAAIDKMGGMEKAVKATVKEGIAQLKAKLPNGVSKHLPQVSKNPADVKFLKTAWPLIAEGFWNLLGFGSCIDLFKAE